MSRKKSENPDKLLTCSIRTRITAAAFKRLEKLVEKSDCRSIGEIVRKILSGQEIRVYYIDASLNKPMEELALIRKELKAIGVNINQITKAFHSSHNESGRAFYALKVADRYETVGTKVDSLLVIVSQLAEKWLQRS